MKRAFRILMLNTWTPEKVSPEQHETAMELLAENGFSAAVIEWMNAAYSATDEERKEAIQFIQQLDKAAG